MGHAQRKRLEQYIKNLNNMRNELVVLTELSQRAGNIRYLISQIPRFRRDINNQASNACGKYDCRTGLYWERLNDGSIVTVAFVPNERPRNQRTGGHSKVPISALTSMLEQAIIRSVKAQPRIDELKRSIKCIINPDEIDRKRKEYGLLSLTVTDKFFKGQFASWVQDEALWNSSNQVIIKARKDLEKYGLPPMECNDYVPKENPIDIAYSHNLLMEALGKGKSFKSKAQYMKEANSIVTRTSRGAVIPNNASKQNALLQKGVDGGTLLIDLSKPKAERKEELRKIKEEKDRIAEEKRQEEIRRLAEIERKRLAEIERQTQIKLENERKERERVAENKRIEEERIRLQQLLEVKKQNELIEKQRLEKLEMEKIGQTALELIENQKKKIGSGLVILGALGILVSMGLKK